MALVIYDSTYGNTRLVAETIAATLGPDAQCIAVDDVQTGKIPEGLLIVGCPINAWRPTPKIIKLLSDLSSVGLTGVRAAAFDTRIDSFFSGNAAKRISGGLKSAGAIIISSPQAFYVKDTRGPLAAGQLDKAKSWAKALAETPTAQHQ